MIGTIAVIILVILVVGACCSSDNNTSSSNTSVKKTPSRPPRKANYYEDYSYCECPSCGAPYYDGYCEECGYPDINQGWIGENY